jgi:hypothetical protein
VTPAVLLESALRAALLGAGVWALLRMLRFRSVRLEWSVWLTVAATGLVMPCIGPVARNWLRQTIGDTTTPFFVGGVTTPMMSPSIGSPAGLLVVAGLLWPLYLGVSALLLSRLAFGLWRTRWLWQHAIPEPTLSRDGVQVRMTRRVDAPAVVAGGILLPCDWSAWPPQTLQRVLAHERSHLARGDFYWQIVSRLHVAIFWASPFAWWLRRRIDLLAEYLSDDEAIAVHGSPTEYAEVLMRFALRRRTALPLVGMTRSGAISRRIERILHESLGGAGTSFSKRVLAFGVAALAVTSIGSPWFRIEFAPVTRRSVAAVSAPTDERRVAPSPTPSPSNAITSPRVEHASVGRAVDRIPPKRTALVAPLTAPGGSDRAPSPPSGAVTRRGPEPLETLGTLGTLGTLDRLAVRRGDLHETPRGRRG